MESSIVFARTELGKEVIEKRTVSLVRELRLALVLVDGHSDVKQIRQKALSIENLEHQLEQLALQGFIESINTAWVNPAKQPARRTHTGATGLIKAKMIDTAILILGNDADKIVALIQDTPETLDELRKTASRCKKIVNLTIDERRAAELQQACLKLLE